MKKKNKTHRKAKCNSNKLVFSSLKRRKILADFNGGKLTSDVGLLALKILRREYLKDTELARAQVGTIRIKLLKVAARVVQKSSRILFHFCSSYPYHQLLRQLICRLILRLNPSFNFT